MGDRASCGDKTSRIVTGDTKPKVPDARKILSSEETCRHQMSPSFQGSMEHISALSKRPLSLDRK